MKVCYLINQYPKVSHSFIRREILELETQGAEVLRIALRGWDQHLVDPQDISERSRTSYILRRGVLPLLAHALGALVRAPSHFVSTLAKTAVLAAGSDKPLLKHLICFVEACATARLLRGSDVTHIHAHFGTNSAEIALLTSLLTNTPYSFTVHGPEEFDHPRGLQLQEKIRHAKAAIAISSYGRGQLWRWAALSDWHKVRVVRCGLDLANFQHVGGETRTPPAFVCVGRLCEQKGQMLLLEALRQVLDAGHTCHVVLAGDGEMRHDLELRIDELRLRHHVTITGWIDESRVRHEIRQARAMALPSLAEGLPVVLMEALALARPVISTYVAGIPELVMHGRSGWLIPAGDSGSLADAMISCLKCGDETLAQMGILGRERVNEMHDIRIEAAKLMKIFATN